MTNDTDLEGLKEAVLKSGFSLEWQAHHIFKTKHFDVKQNLLLPKTLGSSGVYSSQAEIDILASSNHREKIHKYVAECKGTASANRLIMIEAQNYDVSFPFIEISGDVEVGGERQVAVLTKANIIWSP